MFKLSPRRNQRNNKGFKVKHALQICVLGGVCIWLLYQVQHTRNTKESYEESAGVSKKAATGNRKDFIKLGRKDLDPRIAEMTTEDLKNGGQDADEGKSFDDDNKAAAELEQEQEKVEESEPLDRQKEAEVKVGQDESAGEKGNEDDEIAEEESRNDGREEKADEEEKKVESEDGNGKETEKGESNEENGSEERNENAGAVKEVEKQESKEKNEDNVVAAAENGKQGTNDSQDVSLTEKGNAETMNRKEQDELRNSPKNATNHGKSSKPGSGSKLTQVKNGQENNLTNAEPLGGKGKTSLEDSSAKEQQQMEDNSNPVAGKMEVKEQQQMEDNSNPMGGKMEAKEQLQVQDKSVTDSRQTENGSSGSRDNSNAVGNETNLVDNSNPTVGKKKNEQQQEHDNSITGSIQTRNKPVHKVDLSGDGKETVLKEQTDSSDANSTSSSIKGESTSNSTSDEQSSVSAGQTEMTEGLAKQISEADSGSGEKVNPSNDNDETSNLGENNSTDSSTSQNEESSSASTGNSNDSQQSQLESSSSVLQKEIDARTDLETMPQTETAGNNHEAAE